MLYYIETIKFLNIKVILNVNIRFYSFIVKFTNKAKNQEEKPNK